MYNCPTNRRRKYFWLGKNNSRVYTAITVQLPTDMYKSLPVRMDINDLLTVSSWCTKFNKKIYIRNLLNKYEYMY